MAATLLPNTAPHSLGPSKVEPTISHNGLPAIDFKSSSPEAALTALSTAASTTGAALITNLTIRPPITSIQTLFTRLYTNPSLATRLNATYPTRGVFKNACLDPSSSPAIDQKTTIDLSVARLQKLKELDPALINDLGSEFADVLDFYSMVERDILPLLMRATSAIVGQDIAPLHASANNNLRLIDYFASDVENRCGEHRDYGTFTIVFQDRSVGGLEFDVDGKWVPVPADVDAVVSWGWCGAILGDEKVVAAGHRVVRTVPVRERRTTAVVFVAPDLDVVLMPLGDGKGEGVWSERVREGGLRVGEFKEVMGKKWRWREGNEKGEVVEGGQDREIVRFVKGV
jgi:hypothetical protein